MTSSPWSHILRWLAHTWFYFALFAVFCLGWFVPEVGIWMKQVKATNYLIAAAFFLNGLTLSTRTLVSNLRQWKVLLVAMGVIFGVTPLLILAARQAVPAEYAILAVGFQLLSGVPTTLVSAVVLTRIARGNTAIALYITVLANVLSVVVVPLVLFFTLRLDAPPQLFIDTAISLLLLVLLPTVVGQAVRPYIHGWVTKHIKMLGVISQCTILLFIITGLSALPTEIPGIIWGAVFALALVMHGGMLGLGHLAGKLLRSDTATRRALTLSTAQKSLILTVFLYSQLLLPLGEKFSLAVLPGIAYYIIELALDSIIAERWGRHASHLDVSTAVQS